MIKGSNFVIRHIVTSDLSALIPLLNDPDVRGEYLPSAIQSPVELEKKIQADGMANDNLVRLLIVEQQSILSLEQSGTLEPYRILMPVRSATRWQMNTVARALGQRLSVSWCVICSVLLW
jgi:hypothetical protein